MNQIRPSPSNFIIVGLQDYSRFRFRKYKAISSLERKGRSENVLPFYISRTALHKFGLLSCRPPFHDSCVKSIIWQ